MVMYIGEVFVAPPRRKVSYTYRSSSAADCGLVPLDGCVLLGKDENSAICDYATRFYIKDREMQRQDIINDVMMSEVVPCCATTEGCGFVDKVWGFLRSEIVLVCLQLILLTAGYMKIFVHTYQANPTLHLAYAVVETVLTCTIIIIRATSIRGKYLEIKESRLALECINSASDARGSRAKVWAFVYFTSSIIMCGIVLGVLVVCYLSQHLGWISLPDNGLVVFAVFVFRYSMIRYDRAVARIERDQHSMVLLEGATLLAEQLCAISNTQKDDVRSRVEHFLRGLSRTPEFERQPYIACLTEEKPITEAELISEIGI